MIADHLTNIDQFDADLWKMADALRANSGLAPNEYFMPIMGLLFLRQGTNRYHKVRADLEIDQATGKIPLRPLTDEDFTSRRAMNLPEAAHYDTILDLPKDGDLGAALTAAMEAVERHFPPLQGQLPKDYQRFDDDLLSSMMQKFDTAALRTAAGDVFGRIYEYFLAEFSKQGAHDNGEFFTPPAIVQTIVNIIEPDHGIILDPACGSGGMFVQSSHFIEHEDRDTMQSVTFYGHEKNETTARLAQINLAVHGLEGRIRAGNDAITYYKDPHELVGKCDFVMANPPFNVDEVDAEKVAHDPRLPFGLPGVNKAQKISNANYLWLQYFYAYLNENGRAGVVMSSQASSAGRDEARVRQQLVETGSVDIMIDIRGNFFYTRTVPCQLWFLDRAKERDPARADRILMLDARGIYRQVSRAICDFSPEQQKNIAAIIWLYRGYPDRFLALVQSYLLDAIIHGQTTIQPLINYLDELAKLIELMDPFVTRTRDPDPLADIWAEFTEAQATLDEDIAALTEEAVACACDYHKNDRQNKEQNTNHSEQDEHHGEKHDGNDRAWDNNTLHAMRENLHGMAGQCRDVVKQIDLTAKLVERIVDTATKELNARQSTYWSNTGITEAQQALEEARTEAEEALQATRYFVKQADWLQERFPEAELCDVAGLVKCVNRAEIEKHDWSLTPGHYVGIAPDEMDEDFEETLRSIHIDLEELNEEASELATRIVRNFGDLRI